MVIDARQRVRRSSSGSVKQNTPMLALEGRSGGIGVMPPLAYLLMPPCDVGILSCGEAVACCEDSSLEGYDAIRIFIFGCVRDGARDDRPVMICASCAFERHEKDLNGGCERNKDFATAILGARQRLQPHATSLRATEWPYSALRLPF